MMTMTILIMLAGLIALGVSAHYMVGSAVRIAKLLKMPEIIIGLTIVSIGTSAPEIAVSVIAALEGNGALSVGNVIGSNIFNLGFILGLIALVRPQPIQKKMVYRDGVVLLASTVIILAFVWNQYVSFIEGFILLALLVAYNVYLFIKKDAPEIDEEDGERKAKWYDFFIFLGSLAVLIVSSEYVVEGAVKIAENFGISEWAIGVTIVAAGTSLPEIATSVIATFKKKFDIAVGNVVGSDIFNALGIIGVSAVVAPLNIESNVHWGVSDNIMSLGILVATIVLILIMMRTKWKLSRLEGGILLGLAIARMGFELYLGS